MPEVLDRLKQNDSMYRYLHFMRHGSKIEYRLGFVALFTSSKTPIKLCWYIAYGRFNHFTVMWLFA